MKNVFLTPDPPINGQSYGLVSFVSPKDEVLEQKETYCFERFLKEKFAKDKKEYTELLTEYKDFKKCKVQELHDDFCKKFGNATSMRALKLRGN